MAILHELVEDWRAMRVKLQHQLDMLDDDFHTLHGSVPRDTVQRWIVELDDLIIKYAFEI